MNLLIDTHALVWWVSDNPKLSSRALAALTDPDNTLFLSVVAAWEFQWLQMRRRIDVPISLDEILEIVPLQPLAVDFTLHRYSASLPPIHGDPIDRMMIAQAIRHDLHLVTRDENVHTYPVKVLW